MKRIIKFRAWDKKEERFLPIIEGHEYTFRQYKDELSLEYESTPQEDIELMQFICLLDKNGKEIYESDIVVVKNKEEEINDHMQGVGVVGWYQDDLHFGFSKGGSGPLYLLTWFGTESIEVIGNIYQNPELLK